MLFWVWNVQSGEQNHSGSGFVVLSEVHNIWTTARCPLQVLGKKERVQQHPTNTNNEFILSHCEWKSSWTGKRAGREAHNTWALEHGLHFAVPSLNRINIHTGPKKNKQTNKHFFVNYVLLVRIRRYSIDKEDELSQVIEFIYSEFFCFLLLTLILCLLKMYFLYSLHSMYVFCCKSVYHVIARMRARLEVQSHDTL